MNIFKQHAYKLHERGLSVIPCNGKIPLIKDWSSYCQQNPDDNTFKEWEEKFPTANIGVCLGASSGIIAIDIDDEKYKDVVPKSPVVKKGKKGETRFFYFNGETPRKWNNLHIELLSSGNQTIVPPSIHPDGGEYKWVYDTLEDIDSIPVLDQEAIKLLDKLNAVEKRESSESVGGRHNTLIAIAGSMAGRGCDVDEIADELMRHDQEEHNPPYFTDPLESHRGKGKPIARRMALDMIKKEEFKTKQEESYVTVIENPPQEVVTTKAKEQFDYPGFMIGKIVKHILNCSYKKRPYYAQAAAHAVIGTLMGHKYTYKGSTPNLYQIIVGDTGEGKDIPLKFVTKALYACGAGKLIGLSNYRSDKSIISNLYYQPVRIDVIDEFSRALITAKNVTSPNATLLETLMLLYTSTTSEFLGNTVGGITTGLCHSPHVSLLCATTLSGLQDSFNQRSFESGLAGRVNLIFDRNEQCELTRHPDKIHEIPDDIVVFLENIVDKATKHAVFDLTKEYFIEKNTPIKNKKESPFVAVSTLSMPLPYEIPSGEYVEDKIYEIRLDFERKKNDSNEIGRPLYARAIDKVLRYAQIHAISRAHDTMVEPVVELIDLMYGFKVTEREILETVKEFSDTKTQLEKDMALVKKVFIKKNKSSMTKKEITTALRCFTSDRLYNPKYGIVEQMVLVGDLEKCVTKSEKRDLTSYRIITH